MRKERQFTEKRYFSEIIRSNNGQYRWVQTSCPRLTIDWGSSFTKPLLTPYELAVALRFVDAYGVVDHDTGRMKHYPMDNYSNESGGAWTNNNAAHRSLIAPRRPRKMESKGIEDACECAKSERGCCKSNSAASGDA